MNHQEMNVSVYSRKVSVSLITLSVLFVLPVKAQHIEHAAEYLIIEHVDQLLIYDKYQQRITQKEKELFVPFIPMRVFEKDGILNDNYTRCMKVEVQGSIFYLIKNDKTTLMGAGKLGFNKLFNNVTILQDTVQLIADRGVVFLSPDHSHRISLKKGKTLARYFKQDNFVYVRLLGIPARYGWSNLTWDTEDITWQGNNKSKVLPHGIPEQVMMRIELKLNEVNTLLLNLFTYFNKQSIEKKAIPQWHSVLSKQGYTCALEPSSYAKLYSKSNQYLTRDIENILLGTDFAISYTSGRIEIRQK